MASDDIFDPQLLLRQVAARIQSLNAAGIEWLPLGPPLHLELTQAASKDGAPLLSAPASADCLAARFTARVGCAGRAASGIDGACPGSGPVHACPALASTRTQTVFGEGQPGVELCVIGEAPGGDEDASGRPFVGAAGQLLNDILKASGFKREDVYICNIIKCRPPGNRTPLPDETANCRGFLERQLELVQPKFIVAMGGCAATNLLSTTQSVGKLRGRFHDYHGVPVMVTYHPAYLLPHRSPGKKRDVWEDMKMLLARMGRAVPPRE